MENTGFGLLKRAYDLGLTMHVEDEPPTKSFVIAWRNVRAYVGMADVRFTDDAGRNRGWAQLVHVNDPEEVLSDYSVGTDYEAVDRLRWIDEYFDESFARNG